MKNRLLVIGDIHGQLLAKLAKVIGVSVGDTDEVALCETRGMGLLATGAGAGAAAG